MKPTLALLALLVVSVPLSCAAQHDDVPEVTAVLDQTVTALRQGDVDALWALTDPDTQRELISLVRDVHAALGLAPAAYGTDANELAAARSALGEALVDAIFPDEDRAGPKLLERVLALGELRFDDHAMDGVNHRDVTVDSAHTPVQAVVHTATGEALAFVQTPSGWKSRLVRDLVLDSRTVRTLRENISKVREAASAREAAWRRDRDPRNPQGAYNIARDALAERPVNAKVLYTLLDDEARQALLDVLNRSRDAQREVQRRTVRKQRRKAYEEAGLDLFVDIKSDRDLYARWARQPNWAPPMEANDDPVRAEGNPAAGPVDVITVTGARVRMSRSQDGTWRLAGHGPELRAALERALPAPAPAP